MFIDFQTPSTIPGHLVYVTRGKEHSWGMSRTEPQNHVQILNAEALFQILKERGKQILKKQGKLILEFHWPRDGSPPSQFEIRRAERQSM